MSPRYIPSEVETHWQQIWADADQFKADESKPGDKRYILEMFPYPSGRLHMGHVRNYTIGDAMARYLRLKGHNVLHPMGWDAFGLPAENAAIEHKTAPAKWTYGNIAAMREGLKRLGFSYDWNRELATCTPEYYRWEQWLFLRLLEKGIAYRRKSSVNWCEHCHTVLANEQVIEGTCWRCDNEVEMRDLEQWFLRITDYADQLLEGLDQLSGWPEKVVAMQRHWIGKSHGAEIDFEVLGADGNPTGDKLTVFTTRPDTLMGVTFVSVAAEHPLSLGSAAGNAALAAFIEKCRHHDTKEATLDTMAKEGAELGISVRHPLTGEQVPVYAANFVLMGYGTGAVMAVPAHDQRDFEFAAELGLPVKEVISSDGQISEAPLEAAYTETGILVQSGAFDGVASEEAKQVITAALEAKGAGKATVQFRLRDWGVSRQRYWGCPIPVIHCPDCGIVPVPEADLPVTLPEDVVVTGGQSPLAAMESFTKVACPTCGGDARRETDTFDTFFESSWYYARYTSPDAQSMTDRRAFDWLPVGHYVGGVEHAILHLLYARFFHRLMRDEGLVPGDEPFAALLTQGMVRKDTHKCPEHGWLYPEDVNFEEGEYHCGICAQDGIRTMAEVGRNEKMSKSKRNVVDPTELVARFGADTARLFILFAAPPERDLEWSDAAVEGAHRFLHRLWTGVHEAVEAGLPALPTKWEGLGPKAKELRLATHQAWQRLDTDYGRNQFNTAIAACMELLNAMKSAEGDEPMLAEARREAYERIVLGLAPIVPHLGEELWKVLGYEGGLAAATWPELDESALVKDELLWIVQVNGKLRARLTLPADWDKKQVEEAALASEEVTRHFEGKQVRKVIVVPGKLVNIVVG